MWEHRGGQAMTRPRVRVRVRTRSRNSTRSRDRTRSRARAGPRARARPRARDRWGRRRLRAAKWVLVCAAGGDIWVSIGEVLIKVQGWVRVVRV